MKSAGNGGILSGSLQHTQTLISNDEFNTVQTTVAEPLEEVDPGCPVRAQ